MLKDIINTGIFWSNKNSSRNFWSKIKITCIAILLGVVFGFIVIAGLGYNPFAIFSQMFRFAFSSKININTLFIFTAIYSLSGLANAFAFKTGLFNIGVPGQMIAGGATSMFLALTVFQSVPAYIAIPLLIIISILVAGLVGLLVGFLKSQFNVHEVVATILLNWVIFYLFKYIYSPGQSFVNLAGDSQYIDYKFYFGGNTTNAFVASFVFMIVISIAIFCLLKFTTFGRSLKMTGLNKEASKCFGINTKFSVISALAISASIAGILGFVYYFGRQHFVEKFDTTLPNYGFDGIAIALLAFNSPLAIPLISFLYGIFQTGAQGTLLPSSIQNETIMLIFSIIIYFSAISALMINFKPIRFIRLIIILKTNKDTIKMTKITNELIKKIENEENFKIYKIKKEMSILKESDNKQYQELLENYKSIKSALRIQMASIKKDNIIKMIELVDKNTQDKISQNYYLSKYYFFKKSHQKYILAKNQFIIQKMNDNNFSKEDFKQGISLIKKNYKNWLNANKEKQKILRQKYNDKILSKNQYIFKIDQLIKSKVLLNKGGKNANF